MAEYTVISRGERHTWRALANQSLPRTVDAGPKDKEFDRLSMAAGCSEAVQL